MRRRLRLIFVSLLALVLLGLDLPLAAALTGRSAREMFIDRLNDTARFADLAEQFVRTGRDVDLGAQVRQYDEMFGIAVVIVDRTGRPLLASRDGLDLSAGPLAQRLDQALSGRHAALQETFWPWRDEPLVVASPIGPGGEVLGAVLSVSPVSALRALAWRTLLLITAVSLLVLAAGAAVTGPLARWMTRPVETLGLAVEALSEGRFDDRVPADAGPPELRTLATAFNRMADRIATLVERQRSFVSYASHQLRTPLATIWLCLDNLRPSVGPQGADDLDLLADEVTRMRDMCDALLSYARAEVTAADVTTVDAGAVADERVGVWRAMAELAGVGLRREGAASVPVRVAAQVLDQVLDALLSNAVKYAGRGAEVVVSVEPAREGRVAVHVVDDGPGMPAEDLARAAQAFWRRPDHQNLDGSGLGVTVADSLVTASGGRLELLPARPHGLHARIVLQAAGRDGAVAAGASGTERA
ncbi:two-component sensor histidine kinase [Virgisporangium aliadipatigenens]|uniref:histidine kinase n=1 Tax=Virgisporangium aliadipatigenens TaxID=741659 RepID=A0A8J3YJT9_9ACTN|nr:HAMP domain-containing sensor histidine kinase [Virgisporangium aliadipatigenens]GIJ46471.1 two-component sensor histidine kinase [Virgisporangium aliadipatigenens]